MDRHVRSALSSVSGGMHDLPDCGSVCPNSRSCFPSWQPACLANCLAYNPSHESCFSASVIFKELPHLSWSTAPQCWVLPTLTCYLGLFFMAHFVVPHLDVPRTPVYPPGTNVFSLPSLYNLWSLILLSYLPILPLLALYQPTLATLPAQHNWPTYRYTSLPGPFACLCFLLQQHSMPWIFLPLFANPASLPDLLILSGVLGLLHFPPHSFRLP